MLKVFLFLLLLAPNANVYSSPTPEGYTPIRDLNKFKKEFSEATKNTETIQCDFHQEKVLSMLSDKMVSHGKFWFKKTDMLRMEYNQPFQYLLILNHDKVYIKDGIKTTQANLSSNKIFKNINKIIMECVQGTALNSSDFTTRVYENNGTYLIELTPVVKWLKDLFKSINLTVDKKDHSVMNIEMYEVSGDSTNLLFTNRKINVPVSDALFAIH